MKISEFKQFIREEIQTVLKEEAPKHKYKKDDKFYYKGMSYTVVSDNGYVVKALDRYGKEATYNYNQLKAGVSQKSDYLNEEEVSLENLPIRTDMGWEGRSIFLPSLTDFVASDEIRNQEEALQWEKEFMTKYKLDAGHNKIKFKPAPGGRWEVSNSKEFNAIRAKISSAQEKGMEDYKNKD
jgi:hypothetical protein